MFDKKKPSPRWRSAEAAKQDDQRHHSQTLGNKHWAIRRALGRWFDDMAVEPEDAAEAMMLLVHDMIAEYALDEADLKVGQAASVRSFLRMGEQLAADFPAPWASIN
jgi:hypothetical protein